MAFTSLNFLLFFPLLAILYFVTPVKYRLFTLLAGNYFFYMNVKPVYALLLAVITVCTFVFTNLIAESKSESTKKFYAVTNIVLILLPLFFFKYFGAVNEFLSHFLKSVHISWPFPEISLLLPIGISFYTFMSIGYVVDVYNEEVEAEKNIGVLAVFISFFPLLLSGPIERAKNMLPQFRQPKQPDYNMVTAGLKLALWGYFMKLVVADRIGIYVDVVFRNSSHHNGNTLLLASVLYPFQVYADLGGYSLIAIGTASILGYEVMHNFNRPFFATSMADLWRRWHISLITWLTDYIYTPLTFTFRKYKMGGIVLALMITFIISGIWHGAALTFIVWGLLQGIYLSVEALTSKKRILVEKKYNLSKKGWYIFLQILLIFILFTASQIIGRAKDLTTAFDIYHRIFSTTGPLFIGDAASILIFSILGLAMLLVKDFTDEFTPSRFLLFENNKKYIRIMAYASIAILILLIGVFDGGQFIYFKF